jgi:hypothetical protein
MNACCGLAGCVASWRSGHSPSSAAEARQIPSESRERASAAGRFLEVPSEPRANIAGLQDGFVGIERHSDLVVLGRATHTRYMVLAENFPPQIAFHFDASQRDVLRFFAPPGDGHQAGDDRFEKYLAFGGLR